MDTGTGKLYESYDDAVSEIQKRAITVTEPGRRLIPINAEEYEELKGMNRAQRRRWAKENRKRG